MNNNQESFATLIKKLRLKRHQTQSEMASILGLSRGCLANYEAGKRTPDSKTLSKIASALGVSVDFLISRQTPKSSALNEDTLISFAQANERLAEFGNIIDLSEVDALSGIELVDFFNFLKSREKDEDKNSL